MKTLFTLLICFLAARSFGQTFGRTVAFMGAMAPAAPDTSSTNLLITNNLYAWFKADGTVTASTGSNAVNGNSIWKWHNETTSTGAVAEDAKYANCSIPTASGLTWSSTGGPGGKPTVSSGSGGVMTSGGCSGSGTMTLPLTVFMLVKQTTTTSAQSFLWDTSTTAYCESLDYANANGCSPNLFVAGVSGSAICAGPIPVTITNWTVLTCCYNGTHSYVRTNGVNAIPVFSSSSSSPGSYIYLMNYHGGGIYFPGNVSELLFYHAAALATNDVASIESYLKARWGL
jgi:hypothetical protein